MENYKEKLADKKFHNWLKVVLCIHFVRLGIKKFVLNVLTRFHSDALADIVGTRSKEKDVLCSECSTQYIVPTKQNKCPKDICHKLVQKIKLNHVEGKPTWKNTKAERWCNHLWEIAKCYMPPQGYSAADSYDTTDANGVLSIIMNHLAFTVIDRDKVDQAREVTRKMRHSPNFSMDKAEMIECLQSLVQFLEEIGDDSAREASDKINQIREDDLLITTEEITRVLKDEVQFSLKEINKERKNALKQIKQSIQRLKVTTSRSLQDILTAKEENFSELKTKLKEDLIEFSRSFHSTVIVSPVNDKEDAYLLEFYVKPSIEVLEYPNGRSQDSESKTPVSSLKEIFKMHHSNEIYLTSKAGYGKTAFCKHLALTWVQGHRPDAEKKRYFKEEDVEAMKQFNFLFLIFLRDAKPLHCKIDTMIIDQVLKHLGRSKLYQNTTFLQEVLTTERCLIMLDGLDEWSHPASKSCKTVNDIPHRNVRPFCTILTTSRTWKFCSLNLSIKEIDKRIHISELSEQSSEQLIKYAICNFDDKKPEDHQEQISDFYRQMQQKNVQKFKYIPRILMFLVCLWRDRTSFGQSICELFCNIVGMLLTRAKVSQKDRLEATSIPSPAKKRRMGIPNCISGNETCCKYYDLLEQLGHLAFATFFNVDNVRENSLVFEKSEVEKYIGKPNLDFCLVAGLLNQGITPKMLLEESESSGKVSFSHKSFQQFLAAVYASSTDDQQKQKNLETVCRLCDNVNDIFSCEHFLIFISGLCPPLAEKIHRRVGKVIISSDIIRNFRADLGSWNFFVGYNQKTKALQTLRLTCSMECFDNNKRYLDISVEDCVIDLDCESESYSNLLRDLIIANSKQIKSLKIRDVKTKEEFGSWVHDFLVKAPVELKKIDIKCEIDTEVLAQLLKSSPSLSCLVVKGGQWCGNEWQTRSIVLSNLTHQRIWNFKHLENIYLRNIDMGHGQLHGLVQSLSMRPQMKQVGLSFLTCSKHFTDCEGVYLDLSNHVQLKTIELGSIPLANVVINTTKLEVSYVGSFPINGLFRKVMEQLQTAHNLRVFCSGFLNRSEDIDLMLSTLKAFGELQYVWMTHVTLPRYAFRICGFLRNVSNLTFMNVTIQPETLQELVDILEHEAHVLRVELSNCSIEPRSEFERIECSLKKSTKFREIQWDEQKNEWAFKSVGDL